MPARGDGRGTVKRYGHEKRLKTRLFMVLPRLPARGDGRRTVKRCGHEKRLKTCLFMVLPRLPARGERRRRDRDRNHIDGKAAAGAAAVREPAGARAAMSLMLRYRAAIRHRAATSLTLR